MKGRWEALTRDSLITVAAFLLAAALNYAFSVTMGWLLSPAEYGMLSVAQTLYMLGATLLVSGFPWAVARGLAAGGSIEEKRRLFKSALLGNVVFGVLLGSALCLAYAGSLLHLERSYTPLILLVAFAFALMGVQSVFRNALRGLFRLGAFGVAQILEAGGKLVIGCVGVWLGLGARGAVAGLPGSLLLTLILCFWLTRHLRFWKERGWAGRKVYTDSLYLFVGMAGITFLMHLDVLGVKFFSARVGSDLLAGYFQVAATLARPPAFIALAVANAVFPHASQCAHIPGLTGRYVKVTLVGITAGLVPLHLILALFSNRVLAILFPPPYQASAPILTVLALCTIPLDFLFILVSMLQARGEHRLPAFVLLGALVLEGGGMALLVPRLGPIGAALALGGAAAMAAFVLLIAPMFVHECARLSLKPC